MSVDVEKALDKIQHLFVIKTLNKLELEIASPDKDYLQKPTAKIALNGKKFQTFPLRLVTRQGWPLLPSVLPLC